MPRFFCIRISFEVLEGETKGCARLTYLGIHVMKKVLGLVCLLYSTIIFLLPSCTVLNTHSYSVKNLDGNGAVDNQRFSVAYGNDFTIFYDANGTFTIQNDKDSILYIDMANSYFIDADGQAERLFTNSVRTTYSSSTTGTSVNLGSVARVLGAGPITSTLASGVSVAGANTEGVSVQQIEDQYIGIPPYSKVKIKFPALGLKEVFQNKKGTYDYKKPSESQILSYTYSADNPKWIMTRNQFVMEKTTVEITSKEIGLGYPKHNTIKSNNWFELKGRTGNSNEVVYAKNNDKVWLIILGSGAGFAIITVLIEKLFFK